MRCDEDPNTERPRARARDPNNGNTFQGERRETHNSSLFLETKKSKPYPSPKIKIQNIDENEVSDQRCHSYAISDSLTQWPLIHQTNKTSNLPLL